MLPSNFLLFCLQIKQGNPVDSIQLFCLCYEPLRGADSGGPWLVHSLGWGCTGHCRVLSSIPGPLLSASSILL